MQDDIGLPEINPVTDTVLLALRHWAPQELWPGHKLCHQGW
jgi:hypothetical protein